MAENAITVMNAPALPDEEVKGYIRASKAENTIRAYRSDWKAFCDWCKERGVSSLPAAPEIVAMYLAEAARTLKPSTLSRRCSAISVAHEMAAQESPTKNVVVRSTMAGIRRSKGTAVSQKSPVLTTGLRAMVSSLPDTVGGARDRALLLLGFAGAFRRSELAALDVEDVQDTNDGLVVTIRSSKTDQDGAGRKIGIPYGSNPSTCPVRAIRAWLDRSGVSSGPLFRPVDRRDRVRHSRLSDRSVALVVRKAAARTGFDRTRYAGHSLRAGLATAAAAAGVSERAIMAQTGHRSVVVARRYIRDGSLFRENAAGAVGL